MRNLFRQVTMLLARPLPSHQRYVFHHRNLDDRFFHQAGTRRVRKGAAMNQQISCWH